MITHVGIYVESLEKSDSFYRPLLETIGYKVFFDLPKFVAYEKEGLFEIYEGKSPTQNLHIAFKAKSKEEVKKFFDKALELGATNNGEPGYRDYLPGYYAAFVIDLNGHNVEALYMDPDVKETIK